jgi:hypothetical protein
MARDNSPSNARPAAKPKAPTDNSSRPGLPGPEEVVSVTTLRSPKGRTYRVLRTNERDAYEAADRNESKPRSSK